MYLQNRRFILLSFISTRDIGRVEYFNTKKVLEKKTILSYKSLIT